MRSLGSKRNAGLIAEAHGVNFHLLVRIDAVGPLVPNFTRMTEPLQGTCAFTTWPGFAGTPTGM